MLFRQPVSRRRFLGMAAMAAAATTLGATCDLPPPWPPVDPRGQGLPHLAWAWHFGVDGAPERIASVLAQNNLGIILKTHNGTDWMSRWDSSRYAITGPAQVGALAKYFEDNGVPFHTYCVLNGLNPQREAEMCAQVIGAGARSVFLDLEPFSGYWQGTPQSALIFGQEFQRRQPDGTLYLCVDPRPWVLSRIPVDELVTFSQGFAPMVYWETFNTQANVNAFVSSGFPPGQAGVTPEFLLDVSRSLLSKYGLSIHPVGQGASTDDAWVRFLSRVYELGMGSVSVWRYGVTNTNVWPLLGANPPGSEVLAPTPTRTPAVTRTRKPTPTRTPKPIFKSGDSAEIVNTGNCLNLRSAPALTASIMACLQDHTTVTVAGGPVDADGYRWWLIEVGSFTGWATECDPGGVSWLVPA